MSQVMLTYYNKSDDKEWRRLESMLTEFFVNSHYIIREVRDAPDRPGNEFVFIAERV